MYIEIEVPDLPAPGPAVFPYFMQLIFVGTPSQDFRVNALASTFMRLIEAAVVEYCAGALALRKVYANHDSVGLSDMHKCTSHFENCLSAMHRAVRSLCQLRRLKNKDAFSAYVAQGRPAFASGKAADKIRTIRNAIHHLEEKVIKGEILEGQLFAIRPDGKEVPHLSEPGQTIKTFDRLAIGAHELAFEDLANWLSEMLTVATRISEFKAPPIDRNS